jgi:hypothetical protein
VGPNGFTLGGYAITPWESLVAVTWDRDIGQREYGFAIQVRRGRSIEKRRLFVLREVKDEVEPVFDVYLREQ